MRKIEKNLEVLNYISLTSQIIIALVEIKFNRNIFFTINDRDNLLNKGEDIIEEILIGSNFIEKKEFKRGYSPQSITMFKYGIKSLENETKINKKVENYTDFFALLSEKMNNVRSDKSNKDDINLLIVFFKSLNQILDINYKEIKLKEIKSKSEEFDFAYIS